MKLVCDTCGTKYSIDDSRVSGKVFKIRCKKCSGVIILRGALAPVTEPVPDAGVWHVVQGGTQVGPIAIAELHRMRTTGELDDGSLIWREGFDDWRALGTVDELRDVAPPSVVVTPEAAPARPALRSERNETSVLFTLGNLAKLAAPAKATSSAVAGGEGSGLLDIRSLARTLAPAPERVRSERGSFDDLPVYTPATFVEPTVLVPGALRGRDRRLMWALAASLGALAIMATILVVIVLHGDSASAHAAGVLPASPASPAPSTSLDNASMVAATLQTAPASGALAAATPSTTQSAPAVVGVATAATVPTVAAVPTTAAVPTAAAQPSVHAASTAVAAHPAARVTSAAAPSARTTPTAPRRASPSASTASASTASTSTAATVTPPPLQPQRPADSCSEVTCLVNNYAGKCCEIYRDKAGGNVAPTPPAASLPDSLDRPAVAAGIAQVDTSGCRDQSPARGDVTVSVKVSPAGAVTTVTVKSSPAPELSACVTAAARKATFARTQRGGSFAYVWRI